MIRGFGQQHVHFDQFEKFQEAFQNHSRIIILGNGGSSSVASHISQDYMKFKGKKVSILSEEAEKIIQSAKEQINNEKLKAITELINELNGENQHAGPLNNSFMGNAHLANLSGILPRENEDVVPGISDSHSETSVPHDGVFVTDASSAATPGVPVDLPDPTSQQALSLLSHLLYNTWPQRNQPQTLTRETWTPPIPSTLQAPMYTEPVQHIVHGPSRENMESSPNFNDIPSGASLKIVRGLD